MSTPNAHDPIRFGQAVFGDVSGHTDLIASSSPCDPGLSLFADLPESLPIGYKPPPYLSARRIGDLYALYKTAIDPQASRADMVRTHVLWAPVEVVSGLADLGTVLQKLDPFIDAERVRSEPMLVNPVGNASRAAAPPPGSRALLSALLRRAGREEAPVVWIGLDDFEAVLESVWALAPAALKRSLSVRLALKPQNQFAGDREPGVTRLLVVPRRQNTTWSGVRTVSSETPEPSSGPLLSYLEGAENEVGLLLDELNVDLNDLPTFDPLEEAAPLVGRLRSKTAPSLSTSEILLLAELVEELNPSLRPDAPLRSDLLAALEQASSREGGGFIRQLRNFSVESFDGGRSALRAAADSWVTRALNEPVTKAEDAEIAELSFTSHNGLWNEAMQGALKAALRKPAASSARCALGWWKAQEALIAKMSPFIPQSPQHEDAFTEVLEDRALAQRLKHWAETRGWALFHAKTLLLTAAPAAALQAQVAFEGGRRAEALRLVAQEVTSEDLVRAAVETQEAELIELAAQACAADAGLLDALDPWDPAWQRLWERVVIDLGTGAADTVTQHLAHVGNILDGVRAGKSFPPRLLSLLLDNPAGDLLGRNDRAQLWRALPKEAKTTALERTADAWAAQFKQWAANQEGRVPDHPERPLADAIVSYYSARDLMPMAGSIRALTTLFDLLPGYSESDFVQMLKRAARSRVFPDHGEAQALGRFVSRRRWRRVARELKELAGWYPAYRPAGDEASSLLGPLERLLSPLFGGGAPAPFDASEWWAALQELTETLYPLGVRERSIIEKAGGNIARLQLRDKTGSDQWRYVVHGLATGAFGFNARDLLTAMHDDYPRNNQINQMLSLYDRYIAL